MLKIGTCTLGEGAILAPMAGVTDLPFRLLCREQGSLYSVTEMVSAKGYLCAPNQRAVQSLLYHAPQEGPVALQLFGHEPDIMAEAARRLSDRGFFAIDLNMGCPAPKITGGGEGSALLKDLPLCGRMIAAVRKATPLPLTVKTRLGWDEEHTTALPFARMAQAEGVDAIVLHGRTRSQFYSGTANWEAIGEVKAALSIPVIGNGDIVSGEDAIRRIRETRVDGLMVGRGALGNPWLFAQIAAAMKGESYALPTPAQRKAWTLRHGRMLAAWKGEGVAIREMRKHAAWYTKGLRDSAKLRTRLQAARTLEELEEAFVIMEGDRECD